MVWSVSTLTTMRPKRISASDNLGRTGILAVNQNQLQDDIIQPVTQEQVSRSRVDWNVGMKRKLIDSVRQQTPIWDPEAKRAGRRLVPLDQCWKAVAESFGEGITDASTCKDVFKQIKSSINYRIKKARNTMNGNFLWSLSDSSVRSNTLEKIYNEHQFELWSDAEFLTESLIDSHFKSQQVCRNGNVQLFPPPDPLYQGTRASASSNFGIGNHHQHVPSQLPTTFFQQPIITSVSSLSINNDYHQRRSHTVTSMAGRPFFGPEQMRAPRNSAFAQYCAPSPPQSPAVNGIWSYGLFGGQPEPRHPTLAMQNSIHRSEMEAVVIDSSSCDSDAMDGREEAHTLQPTGEVQPAPEIPSRNDNVEDEDMLHENLVGLQSYEQTLLGTQIKQEPIPPEEPPAPAENYSTQTPTSNPYPIGNSQPGGINPNLCAHTATMTSPNWNGQNLAPHLDVQGFPPPPPFTNVLPSHSWNVMAERSYDEHMEREKQRIFRDFQAFVQHMLEHAQPQVVTRVFSHLFDMTQQPLPSYTTPSFAGNENPGHGHQEASTNAYFNEYAPPR